MTETSNAALESSYNVGERPSEPHARKRSGLFAAILSLCLLGLGQVYAGNPRRGLLYWLCSLIGVGALYLSMRLASAGVMFAGIFGELSIVIICAIDAWREARRAPPTVARSRFDRWPTYLLIGLLWILVSPRYKAWLERSIGRAFKIPSKSMEPTLLAGDFIMSGPIRSTPRDGELIVYLTKYGVLTKRIVGLPHDTIAMRDGVLIRNGRSISEPYRIPDTSDPVVSDFEWERQYVIDRRDRIAYNPSRENWGPLVVPAGNYFVLGDNRGNSLDSRYMGFTPEHSLLLSPRFIYFSWNSDDLSVRWNRIGRRLE